MVSLTTFRACTERDRPAQSWGWQQGKGEEQVGIRSVIKKYGTPQLGCLGGSWSVSTQEESENQENFRKGWEEEEGWGLGKWGEGIVLL